MSGESENDDFDIEKYKTEHECDEHWELRKKFILTHRHKFSESELMCLAQVFTNVEFLGCRYPNETMRLISELSEEIIGDYRDKQKNRLQRTFIGASQAATNRSKGRSSMNSNTSSPSTNKS